MRFVSVISRLGYFGLLEYMMSLLSFSPIYLNSSAPHMIQKKPKEAVGVRRHFRRGMGE
ncbi:hypothetical protein GIB67_041376 [Kingdonia uniflora]|uniref:Uncharacterized protein n=1 Tax=Kingdonia uniflora TaxID=39325 RepID=A0A7J7LR98_9MAGN|nr:hypothetical protein GIB67_041376 [Kingdonia uniflora]